MQMANNTESIKDMVAPLLESGEIALGGMIAAAKGRTTAMAAGGAGSMIGHAQVGKVASNARAVGLVIHSPMAVVITPRRLLTVRIKISPMGAVTQVKEVLSAVPLSDIESMTVKRLGLGGILAITPRGGDPIKLECRVGLARELADVFDSAKAAAA
jgi:hypothetical protein